MKYEMKLTFEIEVVLLLVEEVGCMTHIHNLPYEVEKGLRGGNDVKWDRHGETSEVTPRA